MRRQKALLNRIGEVALSLRGAVHAVAAALALVALGGCVAAGGGMAATSALSMIGQEAVVATNDKAIYERNIESAHLGDAEAQFRVGKALCCAAGVTGTEGVGEQTDGNEAFYNNPQATHWLCRAAYQGHGPAMEMLAKIYSGDTVDGLRTFRRVIEGVQEERTNLVAAYAWFTLAGARGVEGAQEEAAKIWIELSRAEQWVALRMVDEPSALLCEWRDVVGT